MQVESKEEEKRQKDLSELAIPTKITPQTLRDFEFSMAVALFYSKYIQEIERRVILETILFSDGSTEPQMLFLRGEARDFVYKALKNNNDIVLRIIDRAMTGPDYLRAFIAKSIKIAKRKAARKYGKKNISDDEALELIPEEQEDIEFFTTTIIKSDKFDTEVIQPLINECDEKNAKVGFFMVPYSTIRSDRSKRKGKKVKGEGEHEVLFYGIVVRNHNKHKTAKSKRRLTWQVMAYSYDSNASITANTVRKQFKSINHKKWIITNSGEKETNFNIHGRGYMCEKITLMLYIIMCCWCIDCLPKAADFIYYYSQHNDNFDLDKIKWSVFKATQEGVLAEAIDTFAGISEHGISKREITKLPMFKSIACRSD